RPGHEPSELGHGVCVVRLDIEHGDDGTLCGLHVRGLHPLAPPAGLAVFADLGPLPIPALEDREEFRLLALDEGHGHNAIFLSQTHPTYARRGPAHRADLAEAEAVRGAAGRCKDDLRVAVRDPGLDELVAVVERDGADASDVRALKGVEAGLLDLDELP